MLGLCDQSLQLTCLQRLRSTRLQLLGVQPRWLPNSTKHGRRHLHLERRVRPIRAEPTAQAEQHQHHPSLCWDAPVDRSLAESHGHSAGAANEDAPACWMWSCGYVAARCCLLETDGSEARLRILHVVLSGYFGSLGLEYSQEYPILYNSSSLASADLFHPSPEVFFQVVPAPVAPLAPPDGWRRAHHPWSSK